MLKRLTLCCALFASLLLAQFDTAQVLGTILDASGLAITDSDVTLTNLQTGVQQKVKTDASGSYQFANVKAGEYKLEAGAKGFKSAIANRFVVTVNARQRVDLKLEVGSTAESITVNDAVAALETDTSSRGTVVGRQQVVNLPLNGRSYADLALLAPGVRRSDIANSRDASFNVNGMRSSQNNFVIDGVDNNSYGTSNQGFSNQVVQLSPDSVQEFRLETNNFSAEFGRAGGAIINASIRSGTNQFHGAAWEYLRNTALNATGFFKPVNNQKPVLIQNQFGGAFGGPIKKDKMFFFVDYEGYRRTSKTIQFSTLPTMEQRTGNLGIAVRNPITGTVYSNGVIPAGDITGWAKEILAGLPAVNRPGLSNNYEFQPRRTDQNDKGDARYDHYFNSKWNAFARYSHRLMNNFEPPSIPGPMGGNSNGNVRVRNIQGAFGTTWNVNPTSLVEFRLGVSATEGGKFPVFVGEPTLASKFNLANAPNDPRFTGGLYAQSVNSYTQFGVQSSNPQFQNPSVFNPKVNYAKIAGRHSLKAGWEYQSVGTEIDDFNPKSGQDSYSGRFSQVPGTPTNNLQFLADFMFGARSSYTLNTANIVNLRQWMNFFYLQDDFKVSKKLTLNLGARYEFSTPQFEKTNAMSNFDPATNTIIQAKAGSIYDRTLIKPDKNNWAPRLGLAYTLFDKTVLRGAFGVSYIHFNRMGGENLLAYNLPFVLNPIVDSQLPPAVTNGQALCTSPNQAPGACYRPTEQGYPANFLTLANVRQNNVRTNYIPSDLRNAYNKNWHFSIQQDLGKGWVADFGYVGANASKLMILGDYNQARPNNTGESLSLQARRPFQAFGYIQAAFNGGFLDYHAFQNKIERRFSGGLYFLNSFTWSKSIDNASGHLETASGDNSRVNFRALDQEKGLSGYDQPFNNTTTLLWDLPFGKDRRWGSSANALAEGVLGGWRLTVINFATAGVPVNLTYGPSAAFQVSGAPNYRPNITGDPVLPEGQRTVQQWLNPATVSIPTDVTRPFGNAGRNIVRAPSYHNMNFGLHKDFRITESNKIEFRMEAFNFFNKTNFGAPNGNRSAGNFGSITGTQPAREIQFALRYAF
ncbi:MAG: TonB-dependent receptor [Bryobacterales bacterium]|nr:TonB-dependent receptor [Bryobacterales bacterium]